MQVTDEIAGRIHDEIGQRHGWSRLWADVGPAQRKDWIEGIAAVLAAEVKGNPHTCHPSHHLRDSDASSYDVVCTKCGETDVAGNGWGKLVEPCAALAGEQPTPQHHLRGKDAAEMMVDEFEKAFFSRCMAETDARRKAYEAARSGLIAALATEGKDNA